MPKTGVSRMEPRMQTNAETPESPSPRPAGRAITALVLGILSVVLGFLICGGLFGIVGLTLGLLYLSSGPGGARAMARWGVGLSIAGILLSGFVGHTAYQFYQAFKAERASLEARRIDFETWHGVEAPNVSWTTLDGATVHLHDLRGRKVILDFWGTWCPPCRKAIPHLMELANTIPEEDLVIVGISSESAKRIAEYAEQEGVNYRLASAPFHEWPSPFANIVALPTVFFIDRNGVIQSVKEGYCDLEVLRFQALVPDRESPPRPAPTGAEWKATAADDN